MIGTRSKVVLSETRYQPAHRGFWWAHVGWVLSNDFDEYDPLAVAGRHHRVPTVVAGIERDLRPFPVAP
jgi:hypothetical protein